MTQLNVKLKPEKFLPYVHTAILTTIYTFTGISQWFTESKKPHFYHPDIIWCINNSF